MMPRPALRPAPRAVRATVNCRVARNVRAGFTLLELMLAAGIAAMLALALYASLSTAMRSRGTATTNIEAMRRAAIALDLIEADFQSVVAPKGVLNDSFVGYALGSPGMEQDSVQFACFGRDAALSTTAATATADDPLAEGVRRVEFSLLASGVAKPSIARRVQRNLLTPSAVQTEDEVLVDDVRAFSVRYFDGVDWLDEWDSTLRSDLAVPVAVQVTIELAERGPRPSALDPQRGYRATRIIPLGPTSIVSDNTGLGGT